MSRPICGRASSLVTSVRWPCVALVMISAALIAQPLAAQDCSIGRDGWDDIQQFRRCLRSMTQTVGVTLGSFTQHRE